MTWGAVIALSAGSYAFKLLGVIADPDYGDITDPESGRDVKVICTRQPGRKWASTEVRPRGKESSLANNVETMQEWIKNIPDVNEMYELRSYDDLSKVINDWLNDDGSEDDDGTTRGDFDNTSSNDEATKDSSSYKSLDDAFADLMD